MTKIYVSSSCVPTRRVTDAITRLTEMGFTAIELSGGTQWYDHLEADLEEWRQQRGVDLLCHNYFPPPRESFVVNLASLDEEILARSLELLKNSLTLSARLGAPCFGCHAGFLVDPRREELGQAIRAERIADRDAALKVFVQSWRELAAFAARAGVALYMENNVYSRANHRTFGAQNPLLLTCWTDYLELKEHCDFRLLLDLAHLKVSCRTLGLDMQTEYTRLAPLSDYWHVSENDGYEDQNLRCGEDSDLLDLIRRHAFRPARLTLEVYDPAGLRDSASAVRSVLRQG